MGTPDGKREDIEAVKMTRSESAELEAAARRLGKTKSDLLRNGWRAYVKRLDAKRRGPQRADQEPPA